MSTEEVDELVDIDKLLVLIEARPVIYNITGKDHHNQDALAKAWQEIGKELNVSSAECKHKWHNVRSSYARYLRNIKKMPSGSGGKKKKWHLAEAMSFLQPYMGPTNKNTCSNGSRKLFANDNFESNEEINPRKKRSKSAAEVVGGPISAYFKSITNKKPVKDHPVLLFFKGLMPDIEKLSQTSQRKFKTDILQCLNRLCEHEEMNQFAVGPHPSPQFSSSASVINDNQPSTGTYLRPDSCSSASLGSFSGDQSGSDTHFQQNSSVSGFLKSVQNHGSNLHLAPLQTAMDVVNYQTQQFQ
ncbi:uncharacterized protein LOC124356512 [Homalodisca vitripennis]|uniref:uncharacterized protein LOC124356512 n=1 Tax=Homalodisca vitripennis TaxID=197043 RepID=UPI001EEAD343|nr:uncharacterized protein LOC124356512 [Homalodisca vitripennis]